jgi:hypothetical protein
MRRLIVTVPAALLLALPAVGQESLHDPIPWANKFFSGRTETPPPVVIQDFGTLPKGTVRTYRFHMANIYAYPMQVREPKPSCGCVSVIEYTGAMKPRETGHIDIRIDTSRVDGAKVVQLPVTFEGRNPQTGEPFFSTARLEVRAVSRPDVGINPGAVAFGTVPLGKKATQTVNVLYTGRQPGWAITDLDYKKDVLDVGFQPSRARGGSAAYEITATLKPTAPAGAVNETIVLKTNDPTAPALTLAVTGTVQAPLALRGPDQDGLLRLGKVEIGKKEEKRVIVLSDKPFKVTKVEGEGDGVMVPVLKVAANKMQVLTVTFAPEKAGPVKKALTIKTDTGDSVTMTVEAVGVEP